ncbi:hypothetical protein H5410_064117 [Solanum commersonii]|uniref:Uncharacterized protein n=1 Tax=Solanum commersonii TaxID=4109 RepID=A0A9J5W0C7_SOLCO|nr:hypothetical protein H5410_064117 [Solanum commersonii]
MIIRSRTEVKILVDRDPVKTSFEEWAKPGHFSRTIAKGPDTTTWIWNLHANAHDFDSHTSDLEEISRKLWRASGITSELQLYYTAIGALVFAALMLFAGWFHYHKAAPKLAWFQDVESMLNHHLAATRTWVSLLGGIKSFGSTLSRFAEEQPLLFTLNWLKYADFVTFRGGLDPRIWGSMGMILPITI